MLVKNLNVTFHTDLKPVIAACEEAKGIVDQINKACDANPGLFTEEHLTVLEKAIYAHLSDRVMSGVRVVDKNGEHALVKR